MKPSLQRLIHVARVYKAEHGSLRGCNLSTYILACIQDGYHFHDIQPHIHAIEHSPN